MDLRESGPEASSSALLDSGRGESSRFVKAIERVNEGVRGEEEMCQRREMERHKGAGSVYIYGILGEMCGLFLKARVRPLLGLCESLVGCIRALL